MKRETFTPDINLRQFQSAELCSWSPKIIEVQTVGKAGYKLESDSLEESLKIFNKFKNLRRRKAFKGVLIELKTPKQRALINLSLVDYYSVNLEDLHLHIGMTTRGVSLIYLKTSEIIKSVEKLFSYLKELKELK